MNRKSLRVLLTIFGASFVTLVVLAPVLSQPQQVSNRLLRIGGRFLKKVADNLDTVAVLFVVCVAVIWFAIIMACWLQSSDQKPTAK